MVQTEAQYKFVYLAVQHHIETITERMKADQVRVILKKVVVVVTAFGYRNVCRAVENTPTSATATTPTVLAY